MDLKKKSQQLKSRAKELGYEIKLTHAQELVAKIYGHSSRHSALIKEQENQTKNKASLPEGIIINQQCQICERRPRSVAHYHWSGEAQIWLLCTECVKHPSKFSIENGNKDVTSKYDLKSVFLRDVMFDNGEGIVPGTRSKVRKSFRFQLICLDGSLGDRYLFVPGLWSGHSTVKVWNIDKNQEANGWWDWNIIVLPSN